MDKKNKMGITGMWIPGEVAFNKELTLNDMFVWWVINSLDCSENNCWASNEYIAKLCGSHSQTVSSSVAKLKKHGYIKQISFDGRVRRLAICTDYVKKYKELTKNYNKLISGDPKSLPRRRLSRTTEAASEIDLGIYNNDKSNNYEKKDININVNNDSSNQKKTSSYDNPEDYSNEVQSLFSYWQNLGIRKHKPSKTRDHALQQLNIYIHRYSIEDITESMDRYKQLLKDGFSILSDESPYKVGLDEFFGFNRHTKTRIKNTYIKLKGIKSWFEECRKEDLSHLMYVGKNPYPLIAQALKKGFKERIGPVSDSTHHENLFRKASRLLMEFHLLNKDKLTIQLQNKPGIFAKCFIEYLESSKSKNGKHPGWLCTDVTWEVFPVWLSEKGYTSEENDTLSDYR